VTQVVKPHQFQCEMSSFSRGTEYRSFYTIILITVNYLLYWVTSDILSIITDIGASQIECLAQKYPVSIRMIDLYNVYK